MEEWKMRVSELGCLHTCRFVESIMIRLRETEKRRADGLL